MHATRCQPATRIDLRKPLTRKNIHYRRISVHVCSWPEHTTIVADQSRQLTAMRAEQQRQSATVQEHGQVLAEVQSLLSEVVGIVRRLDAR
jgi:Mg2+/Co2+ transporter CorB